MSALHFTLVQADLYWEDKKKNLIMFEEKIRDNVQPGQVVILPEMFSTGFSMKPELLAETMTGDTMTWMEKLAHTHRIIITGSLIIEENGNYYNRLIWMLPNGQYGYYNKRHLFAYAEEDLHYTAGAERFIASVNGWKIFVQVCYDLRFPVWARQQYKENKEFEYDVLICVANWPTKRSTAWKTLLQARAIENQCYVIGVNRVGKDGNDFSYSGDSMVVDPLGKILYQKADEEDVFSIGLDKNELEKVREHLPFWKDADKFEIKI